MRLFQNSGIVAAYRPRLKSLTRGAATFSAKRQAFLDDRYGASHTLKPALDGAPDAFFTNGDDEDLQRAWAAENGMKPGTSLEDILLGQIEAHHAEVFYNTDPVRYPSSFLKRLPACVKKSIAWRAAPSGKSDFGAYDLIVCNFPSIIAGYRQQGWRGAYFAPAHDPAMDAYAARTERPIDVLFVGGYSRHHRNRAAILEAVAALRQRFNVVFHIDRSRATALAETPLGWVGPLKSLRRPRDIRRVSAPPIFGRDLYDTLSKAKIVLNGAIDMAGADRGNMRCWEATGCRAVLLSDEGNYPPSMTPAETMLTYSSAEDAANAVTTLLGDPGAAEKIARAGYDMIKTVYSKERQWQRFLELAT